MLLLSLPAKLKLPPRLLLLRKSPQKSRLQLPPLCLLRPSPKPRLRQVQHRSSSTVSRAKVRRISIVNSSKVVPQLQRHGAQQRAQALPKQPPKKRKPALLSSQAKKPL